MHGNYVVGDVDFKKGFINKGKVVDEHIVAEIVRSQQRREYHSYRTTFDIGVGLKG